VDDQPRSNAELRPLPYHLAVVERLQELEPTSGRVFRDAARAAAVEGPPPASDEDAGPSLGGSETLEEQLLRHAYRLDFDAHPRVGQAARAAAAAVGVTVPISVYQLEGVIGTNAALAYRPSEAVLALTGNILGLLADDELVACFAHELAHHRLWSAEDGRILVADRLLDALSVQATTPPPYLETARRFDLATELYADRGSLVATGDLGATIRSLVKATTGLGEVDADAFLRQAEAAKPETGARGESHPETVLRAWALDRWQAGEGESAVMALLGPSIDIERIDIFDRERLDDLTHRLIETMLAPDWIRTEPVVSHAHQFSVDLRIQPKSEGSLRDRVRAASALATPPAALDLAKAPEETRRFLSYVLLDLATVDADLEDEGIVEAAAVARETCLAKAFETIVRKELQLKDRAWDAVHKRAAERRVAAATESVPPTAEPPSAPDPA
jgi:hypothetical protein